MRHFLALIPTQTQIRPVECCQQYSIKKSHLCTQMSVQIFIVMLNSIGPKIEPWGTPQVIGKRLDLDWPTFIVCVRLDRYDLNMEIVELENLLFPYKAWRK